MKEIVICAAIRMPDGYIVRGHRHADAIHAMRRIPKYAYGKGNPHGDDQGFVTSLNRYVNREEGCKIQNSAGIPSFLEGTEHADGAYLHGELYSEDLY